jgi:hypothetical protein
VIILEKIQSQPPSNIPKVLWNKFRELYDSPSDIDLFTAGMAENTEPGAHVGSTFGCIIATQFRGGIHQSLLRLDA